MKINISTYENKSAKNGQIRSRPRQVGEGKYNNFLVVFVPVINTIIEGKHCQGTWHSVNTRYLLDSWTESWELDNLIKNLKQRELCLKMNWNYNNYDNNISVNKMK